MVLDRVFAWAQGLGAPDAGEVVAHEMAAGGDAATPAYRLLVVPALSDNYMYVVLPTAAAARGRAVAIDVADADRLAAVLARERVHALDAVLSTHYHSDHSGGNAATAARFGPSLPVIVGAREVSPEYLRRYVHTSRKARLGRV